MNVRSESEWSVIGMEIPVNAHERAGIAAAIRQRRKQLGLRQEDLADLSGVSLRFLQALEAGKPSVQLDRVQAVLATLGLRLDVVPERR
jgi:HTH-type transcriptional regulator / antitoxin HipB